MTKIIFKEKIKWRIKYYRDLFFDLRKISWVFLNISGKKDYLKLLAHNLLWPLKINILAKYNPEAKSIKGKYPAKYFSESHNKFFYKKFSFIFKNLNKKEHELKQELIRGVEVDIKEIFIDQIYQAGGGITGNNDIVLDCGANIGLFSIWASNRCQTIYAFEPGSENIDSLRENLRLNQINNVCVVPLAILDKQSFVRLLLNRSRGNSVIGDDSKLNGAEEIESVQSTSIDEFCEKEGSIRVDFIKMDIEGAEECAALGASETIKKHKPRLAIEVIHKPDNFYRIPFLIKSINADYRIFIKINDGVPYVFAF